MRGTDCVVAIGAMLRASVPKEGNSPFRLPDLATLAGCVASGVGGTVLVTIAAAVSGGL